MEIHATTLVITDPTYRPKSRLGILDRAGLKLINDPRDLPFIRLQLLLTFTVIPFAVLFYIPSLFTWWLAPVYLGLVLGIFLGPFILMLHNTSHRTLFKPGYSWMRHYIPWILSPFFGQTPETYYTHHIGMHHPENNMDDDLSCTMRFQRDSLRDFMRYLGRFYLIGPLELAIYLRKKGRRRLFVRTVIGEYGGLLVIAALLWFNWQATLVVFVLPIVFARFAMMAGNWAQHAFIDAADPENCYRNSITCINTLYNRRCFNDGYHIGHHLKANRHWTEMPVEFQANKEMYAREGAIVFEGVDFFQVWFLLMIKRYDILAKRYVNLDGVKPGKEEIMRLLRQRTERIVAA